MSVVDAVFASLGLDEHDERDEREADTGGWASVRAARALAAPPRRPPRPRPGSTVDKFAYKSRDGASVRRVVTAVTKKKKLWQYLVEHNVNHRADCNAYAFDDNNAFMAKDAGFLKKGRRIPVDYPHDPVVFCDEEGWTMVGDLLAVVRTVATAKANASMGRQASSAMAVPAAIARVQTAFPQTFVALAARALDARFGSGMSCTEMEHPKEVGTWGQQPATVAGWYPLANKTHFGPRVTAALRAVNDAAQRVQTAQGAGRAEVAEALAASFAPGSGTLESEAAMFLDHLVQEKFETLSILPNAMALLNGTSDMFPCVQGIGVGDSRLARSFDIEMSALASVPRTPPKDGGGPTYTRYDAMLHERGVALPSYNLLRDAHWVFLRGGGEPSAGNVFGFAHEVPDGDYARAMHLPWDASWAAASKELRGMSGARGGYLYLILGCSSGAGVGAELGQRIAALACSLGYTRFVLSAAPAPASLYYKTGLRFCNRLTGAIVDASAFESPPGSGRLVTSATLARARGDGPFNERAVGAL